MANTDDVNKKDFYISDSEFNAVPLSTEEALAKRLTRWKGWFCAAGYDNIHITADGNVYSATCKVGGLLTNIYDSFGSVGEHWIECDKEVCACGSDMQLKKTKRHKNIPISKNLKSSDIKFVENIEASSGEYVGPIFDDNRPTCTWDLGRRCNYSCDYCNDSISNNYEAHKSWGSLEFAYSKVKRIFCRGRATKFVFTGGEPTLNPNYFRLVQQIHADGHLVHTQTNGSQTSDYFAELIKYSFIGISVHLKFYNKEKLFKNIQVISEVKKSDEKYRHQWLGVRIMAPPGRGREAVLFLEELKTNPELGPQVNDLCISHTYLKNDAEKLDEYSVEEFRLIQKYN